MKILFWVPYPTEGASNRYRVEQYLPYLKAGGMQYCLRPFWSSSAFRILYEKGYWLRKAWFFIQGTVSRICDIIMIGEYDIVFIHREAHPIGGPFFETILSMLGKPFIFDFDDAIFLLARSSTNNFIDKFKRPSKIAKIIKMSDHVIVGNIYLANYALRYNKNTTIIPTPIDTDRYYPNGVKPKGGITLGWIGSDTTIPFLTSIEGSLRQLSKKFDNLRFKIIGADSALIVLPNAINKPWSLNSEIEDLRGVDIGIMPMPEDEWTKGKCGFKAILYMSMGIATVCSPVGVNSEIIEDGVNGFLASSGNEWIEKLSCLIEDPALRRRLGVAGRKTIEERYSIKVNAPKYIEVLRSVYDNTNRQGRD